MSGWYLYENEEVRGPFETEDLQGKLRKEVLVCRAGEKKWRKASNVEALNDLLAEPNSPGASTGPSSVSSARGEKRETGSTSGAYDNENIIEPTLDNFLALCEKASDRDLLNEYETNLTEYDSLEREILVDELQRRDLIPQA